MRLRVVFFLQLRVGNRAAFPMWNETHRAGS
jgi:hypothetical protein